MIVISTNSEEWGRPGPRELMGNYKKTIIVITGDSEIGKSSLSELLLKDSIYYLSMDIACQEPTHDIKVLVDYIEENKDYLDAGVLGIFINENCYQEFVDHFFQRFIVDNENLNIMLDGYFFILEPSYSYFLKKCELYDYRVWDIRRLV